MSKQISPAQALQLDLLPFVSPGPPQCTTFTKATPSGQKVKMEKDQDEKLNLSGADPYNSLMLPLAKALDHTRGMFNPQNSSGRMPLVLALCISVLDAPMLLVESPERASDPVLTPWVRVFRQQAEFDAKTNLHAHRFYTVDVVHADYLEQLVTQHLLPFAQTFVERAQNNGLVALNGGTVVDLERWDLSELTR